jgi:hypothetical protein
MPYREGRTYLEEKIAERVVTKEVTHGFLLKFDTICEFVTSHVTAFGSKLLIIYQHHRIKLVVLWQILFQVCRSKGNTYTPYRA